MTATKIMVLGLDACDPDLARQLAAAGEMPTLARLLAESGHAISRNPYGLFVGSLWSTFFTARSAARTGFHCWEEVDPQSYERSLTSPLDIKGVPFWETLSGAGKRVCVIDVPHSRADVPLNGLMVSEYGCHDRHFGLRTTPPELAKELEAEFDLHPIFTADPYEVKEWAPDDYLHRAGEYRTRDEERLLLTGMLEGLERKNRLSADLLRRDDWDLFLSIFGESHAVGHQQWHLHDSSHRRHDADLVGTLGDPVLAVYRGLDAVLADHLAAVGPDTTVFVLLSHGMAAHYDGDHLLHEILRRLDRDSVGGNGFRRAAKRAYGRLPAALRRLAQPGAVALLRRRLAAAPLPAVPNWTTPDERASMRFFLSPNNTAFGGVRINLVGREPHGRVQPGAEFDAVCDSLTESLLSLVNLDTGRPVVNEVSRLEDHYERDVADKLPDLLIDWARDAPIETVWSPSTGIVHGPYVHWRTGDHRPDGLLLASGPGIVPGADLGVVHMTDYGVSLAARLGVTLTGDIDGRQVPWIADTAPHPAAQASASGVNA